MSEKVFHLKFKEAVKIVSVLEGSVMILSNGCKIFDHYRRDGGGEAHWDISCLIEQEGYFEILKMFIVEGTGLRVVATTKGKIVIDEIVNCYDTGEDQDSDLELRATIQGIEIITNIEKACARIN